jgi:hypothetical protein
MGIALHTRHIPYSPDLAPSDLFLVRHLKNRLQGQQFGPPYEFFSGVRKNLDETSLDILEAVFWESINRLDRCTAALQRIESASNEVSNDALSYS